MGILDSIATRLGYSRLTNQVALEYVSPWAPTGTLNEIDLQLLWDAADQTLEATRGGALTVGTVAAGRQTIVGLGSRLPFYTVQGAQRAGRVPALLEQPELGTPLASSLAWLYDQLLFYPRAWWVVTQRQAAPAGALGFPVRVRRVEQADAITDNDGRLVGVRGYAERVPDADVITFDSPSGGLLLNAGRTIRRAIALEAAAALAEDNPVPTVELHDEGSEKLSAEQVDELLEAWSAARRRRGVAYTPRGIKVVAHGQHQSQLLIEGRRAISLDLVRHMNLPAWAASTAVEGATMTYDNRSMRNWELIDLTMAAYFTAVAGRLSMPDVTPRGTLVRIDTDEITRPDQQTRFSTYEIGLRAGFITPEWVAEQEGWSTPTRGQTP